MNRIGFLLLTGVFTLTVVGLGFREEKAWSGVLRLMPPPGHIEELAQTRDQLQRAMHLLETCFGGEVDLNRVRSIPVTITAYSSTPDQCDATPHVTASSQSVRVGILAASADLFEEMGLSFGQRVLIPGYGLFEVHDRMHPRWKRRVDIWESDSEAARRFGKKQGTLILAASSKESA